MITDPRASDPIAALHAERARLREQHERGLGGLALARALAAATDHALAELWRRLVGDDRRIALVALGGYGRGELSPRSDLDLMVLHDRRGADDLSRPLFYALWDAGYVVGHATRTPKQSLRLAAENLEAETSFLHARLVAGDADLFASFAGDALAATRKRRAAFLAGVREMMRARHATGGKATSQLEPNLKEGTGGLRDLHVIGWFERLDGVEHEIGVRHRAGLADAAELLTRVRNQLHYATEHPTDVLLFAHQRPTALFLGYEDGARPAEDAFMRDLFHATRAVEHVVRLVVAERGAAVEDAAGRTAASSDPFIVRDGRVELAREPDLAREPACALALFGCGAPPGAAALRWLEGALDTVGVLPWTDEVRRTFLELLRLGDPGVLESLDVSGVLGALLPSWEAVRCQPQHNVYHRYTVDAHLFNAVAEVRAVAEGAEGDLARDVWTDLSDPDALLLAALLHDIGKGGDEDHSQRGERMAAEILDRMGVREPRRSAVAWLVRNHLMLVDTATRRDLDDENLVVETATRIGDPERARLLYLLTVADGRATGPTAWNTWRAGLVAELFAKVMHVFERGELATRDAVELARLRVAELRAGLARYPREDVERHIEGMPRAYILAFPATALIRHFALMAEPLGEADARVHRAPGEDGAEEITVVARDRPGLLAKVSGVLALHGVNILAARGYTRSDGIAVEVLRCAAAHEESVPGERWERVAEDLRRALRGRLALDVRLAEKRRAYAGRARRGKRRRPQVIVDNAASDFLTVVEVHAPDRIGVLYDITTTFAELALDIQSAKIATYGEEVVDVFYVRDLEGQKIVDGEHLREIERSLLHRLAPEAPHTA